MILEKAKLRVYHAKKAIEFFIVRLSLNHDFKALKQIRNDASKNENILEIFRAFQEISKIAYASPFNQDVIVMKAKLQKSQSTV